jgi:class 3 adenylate cyclase
MEPMPTLPSGTVTFAFTDIEGSTSLLKQLGERYRDVLTEHRRIMRETFEAANGIEIDTHGDAFFFVFPSARDAVTAAVGAQREHAVHDWPSDAVVLVRMGLHTGEPALGEEGYLGLDVVRAARICTVARGGTVLLSESTRALLGSALPDGVAVFPRGERQLKDIDEPERVYELDIEGVAPAETTEEQSTRSREEPVPASSEQSVEGRIEDFGARLAADIQEHVLRTLEGTLGAKRSSPPPTRDEADDADLDDIAARASSFGEQIRARVAAALEAKGISADGRAGNEDD